MNTLRPHLANYLKLRRQLGFKLRAAGILLNNFVQFAERQRASVITSKLALRWATQPRHIQQVQRASAVIMLTNHNMVAAKKPPLLSCSQMGFSRANGDDKNGWDNLSIVDR
jgi:hypothetical protein